MNLVITDFENKNKLYETEIENTNQIIEVLTECNFLVFDFYFNSLLGIGFCFEYTNFKHLNIKIYEKTVKPTESTTTK